MNDRNEKDNKAGQTADSSQERTINNPFANEQKVDQEVQLAQEELEKEQQFKEAQTERD